MFISRAMASEAQDLMRTIFQCDRLLCSLRRIGHVLRSGVDDEEAVIVGHCSANFLIDLTRNIR